MPRTFFVYVIELDRAVLERRAFLARNPAYRAGRPCVYVGSSYNEPDVRFDQHKAGYRSNRFVRRFGERLLPDLFARYNPAPSRKDAEEIEAYLADRLRGEGWAVWQG